MVKHVKKMTLKDSINSDLHLFSFGGIGGFHLLYQLLLTEKFYCYFNGMTIQEAFEFQYNDKPILGNWRDNEIWPDNNITRSYETSLRKIYYNANHITPWIKSDAFKICLWTDYKSHLRLASNKKSFFYNSENPQYDGNYFTYTKNVLKDYNSREVYSGYKVAMKKADLNVKTQEVWTKIGLEKFLNAVGCEIQQKNIDFLQKFLNFHPKKLLQKIGVSSEVV